MSAPGFLTCLGLLMIGHAIGDVALQPGWLAIAKRPGGDAWLDWPSALGGHAAIHGLLAGDMLIFAGVPAMAAVPFILAETMAHGLADFAKCRGAIGMKTDQAIHVGCKVMWAAIAVGVAHG